MTWLAAIAASAAVFALVTRVRPSSLTVAVHDYLVAPAVEEPAPTPEPKDLGFIPWILGGAVVGLLLAQGDLFLSGAGRSAPALGILGGAGGWLVWSSRRTSLRQRRALRLRHELPVVADAIALHAVAGESVSSALSSVATQTTGVAAAEFAAALERLRAGEGLAESLAQSKRSTAHPDAERLYEVLIQAHGSGGRLSASLSELAVDFRSSIASDLTSEGGKRAITSYGPVLALMVPTALLFLLYPTLLGLRALSGAP
ncbi:MAG: type II secretion system F family protein [Actinomycetota bacterium]